MPFSWELVNPPFTYYLKGTNAPIYWYLLRMRTPVILLLILTWVPILPSFFEPCWLLLLFVVLNFFTFCLFVLYWGCLRCKSCLWLVCSWSISQASSFWWTLILNLSPSCCLWLVLWSHLMHLQTENRYAENYFDSVHPPPKMLHFIPPFIFHDSS